MKGSRFTEEQIIGILKEQESGSTTLDVCRRHGISSPTFYKWKAKYGGLEVSEAKRLKALEDENNRLKKLLAEAMLVHVAWRGTQHSLTIALTPSFIQRTAAEPFDGNIPKLRPMVALRDPAITDLVSCLRREMAEDNLCRRLCLEYAGVMLALRLFTTYGEETKSLPAISGGLGASRQRRILDYIDAHLREDIGLDELAGEAGLSSYHFGKAFKASLGVPPCRYVTERRIHRAKELLLGGHGSITEIAHDLGFSSHSHFTDVFRKTTGATPSQFRRDRL